ncbi:MAG: ADP-ribosylglycohydrolase family protein [Candidatus Dormibacter sp.]
MAEIRDHRERVAAGLRGAIAAQPQREAVGAAHDMLAVAESIAAHGGLDVDDVRERHLDAAGGTAALVAVLPFGLATPLDRPRVRRDAYRFAAATGVDEGTALLCVAAALVAADLLRFDPVTTAVRVRQSLLEDAPMALLDRLILLTDDTPVDVFDEDPGAALQTALSAVEWTGCAGVAAVLARLGEAGRGQLGTLAAVLAGIVAGDCDVPTDGPVAERADGVAEALVALGAAVAS